jgi:hypothetical protein
MVYRHMSITFHCILHIPISGWVEAWNAAQIGAFCNNLGSPGRGAHPAVGVFNICGDLLRWRKSGVG